MRQHQGIVNFNGFINDLLNSSNARIFGESFLHPNDWNKNAQHVPVNVKEKNNGFYLEVIVPGIAKEDIKIDVESNILSISFESKKENATEEEVDSGKVLKNEFQLRSFKRSFKLSDKIDIDQISAKYENGILNVSIPKKEIAIVSNKVIAIA